MDKLITIDSMWQDMREILTKNKALTDEQMDVAQMLFFSGAFAYLTAQNEIIKTKNITDFQKQVRIEALCDELAAFADKQVEELIERITARRSKPAQEPSAENQA